MDRYDEKKSDSESSEMGGRDGDILGLGGSAVPKEPGDPTASNDPDEVRRRRERAMNTDEESATRDQPDTQHSGATGIDMGGGGGGTDVSGR